MVTIEADNYDEAIKQARKQKRQVAKQAKLDKAKFDMSYLEAEAAIGRIACRLLDDSVRCNFWEHPPQLKSDGVDAYLWRVSNPKGVVEVRFYQYVPRRELLDGAGFVLAIESEDLRTHKTEWFAVGICEDKAALRDMPQMLQGAIDSHLAQREREAAESAA
jgi:hypothetical protein